MKNLLFVSASLSGERSRSRTVARELIAELQAKQGRVRVVERDLGAGIIPHLSGEYVHAISTPSVHRTARQSQLAKTGDALIEELETADVILIAAPMYNFSIPSTLKAWLDYVVRSGRTFRYTGEGRPEGLLRDKKIYVVAARGGIYVGDSPAKAMDFQEPYLRTVLNFIGLSDVTFIHVEGQAISPVAAEAGLERARVAIKKHVPQVRAAA